MILVVGATGVLGSEICRRLRARGLEVRALVRPALPKAAALRKIGVEISAGDLRNRTNVEAACYGVSAVITTATAMGSKDKSLTLRAIDRDAQLQLVEVAKESRVTTFVYTSLLPHLTSNAPLVRYKREVEAAVRASGMRYTILQPSLFMDIWLSKQLGFDVDAAKATIFGAGVAPLAWISVGDVAEHAVKSLDDARLANQMLPLGGAGLSPNEVVSIFERASGRTYKTKHVPRMLLAAMGPVAGIFNEMAASGMSLMVQAADGDPIGFPLQASIGLPLVTVEQYAKAVSTTR